jgi:hypothetical protein
MLAFDSISAPLSADPVLSREDTTFLHDQAMRIVQAARVAPGEKSGGGINTTPYVMHLPDSHQAYTAFWVRDSNMALGGDFVSETDVRDWIKLTVGTISNKDWQVRPGVLVPAYSVPDHINFDGVATYFPGNYEEGDKQGGGYNDSLPPLDDAFFFLFSVNEQAAMSKSVDFFNSQVKTKDGDLVPLRDLCLKVFDAIPVDVATGIPITGKGTDPNAHGKDFGFCDTILKTGKLMFTAVLRYDAALRIASLYRKAGQPQIADRLLQDAALIKKNLGPTFYREGVTSGEGWLSSATGDCNQPDVWGSAYAVAIGAVDATTAPKVARALLRGFKDRSTVISGNVSEVLPHDPAFPHGWEKSQNNFPTYQNGGYWATPSGWYIVALNTTDPAAAQQMARDYVDFMRANRMEDGVSQAWEWFDPNTNTYVHPQYVASAAFTYGILKRANLLP